MNTALIICEKPSVAKKIANALGNPKKKTIYSVPYYELVKNGKKIIVASAVGHLFTLVEKNNNQFGNYPVFDIKWVPASVENGKKYVNNYIKSLKSLSKKANEFYIATDWDIEGELIGYHALKYCCNKTKAKRMRFSSLTKNEIIKAYENPDKIDYGLVDAGESRHIIDWYYGINLSRALMNALKAVNQWKIMSIGRVQGATLSILVDRELAIKNFTPKPYWVIEALLVNNLVATHQKEKFWDWNEAKSVYEKIKNEKWGRVVDINRKVKKIKPLPPFDLGTLQSEAYSYFKISPKETQEIAQKLYEMALLSYPRSSSQKLPRDKNYLRNILNTIKRHPIYGKWAEEILKRGNLTPIEGSKEDMAHPAIHIVDIPKEGDLTKKEELIYDLIARRTLNAFWDCAEREYLTVKIDIKGEIFKLSGSRTLKEGWHEIYYFPKFDDNELPKMNKGDLISVRRILINKKMTQPPDRYTVASIIKELERRKLGTKSTRAEIVEKLLKRGYIVEERGVLKVTDLGMAVLDTLKKFCPEIIDVNMTRDLEEKLEDIQFRKIKKDIVIGEAKKRLIKVLESFKQKERDVGEYLVQMLNLTKEKRSNAKKNRMRVGSLRNTYSYKTNKRERFKK